MSEEKAIEQSEIPKEEEKKEEIVKEEKKEESIFILFTHTKELNCHIHFSCILKILNADL
jgi:hypothetical protein